MSGFIAKAACRGRRPSQFLGLRAAERQELVMKLLKERTVARFLVAPSGYGKTFLAIEYADTVFAWVHTFFVNCQSPCFIRDLDDGSIASACFEHDGDARLVIFDAVPVLDGPRAERFSEAIDALLSSGCEVVVTCVPSSDVFGHLQGDRLRIGAADLLLSDDELRAHRQSDEGGWPPARAGSAVRVPALVFDEDFSARVAFLRKSFKEPLPSELLLAMAGMYVLGRGSLGQLEGAELVDASALRYLAAGYPHLGIDEGQSTFSAPELPLNAIEQALRNQADSFVERAASSTREQLAGSWAHVLMQQQESMGRACDVIRTLCPRQHRGRWIAAHATDLVRAGCFYPLLLLIRSTGVKSNSMTVRDRAVATALEAVCCMLLGDDKAAAPCAERYAFDSAASPEVRAACLVVLLRTGPAGPRRRAQALLDELYDGSSGTPFDAGDVLAVLARARHALSAGAEETRRTWASLRDAGASDAVLLLVAASLFERVAADAESARAAGFAGPRCDFAAVERFVRERVDAVSDDSGDFFVMSAALAMERAHEAGMGYSLGRLSTATLLALRRAEMSVVRQRQQLEHEMDTAMLQGRKHDERPADEQACDLRVASAIAPARQIPVLELKMFGRFGVSVGGMSLDPKKFRRQNVRAMLVLLAVNEGRDLTRDTVAEQIWPNSPLDVGRKNFYSVWSQLKRSLTLSDGSCPYLIRHQYGCGLEDRYVRSDVDRLNQICRDLLFGRPDVREWSVLYDELERDFSNDLMPGETNSSLVVEARDKYRMKLVDALVAATLGLIDIGYPQWGIWYSRMAISRDKLREDAYVALMRAQAANGQRGAATLTFMECKQVLAEELGVDPSPETQAFYESLLE